MNLEIKLRQFMRPGMPYSTRDILVGTGLELKNKESTIQKKLAKVKCIYFKKEHGLKLYYIDPLPVKRSVFSRFYNDAMDYLEKGRRVK